MNPEYQIGKNWIPSNIINKKIENYQTFAKMVREIRGHHRFLVNLWKEILFKKGKNAIHIPQLRAQDTYVTKLQDKVKH